MDDRATSGASISFQEQAAVLRQTNELLRTEIAERKRVEAALRQSEENLSITLHSIGDAVMTTDVGGNVTCMNPAAQRLTGWPFTEAVGRPLTDVFHIISALTRQPATNPVQRVMERGEVVGLANHTALLARDGMEYQISDSAAPIRDAAGRIVGVVLVFSDVTEQYRVQQTLHASEQRYRLLFESMLEGFALHEIICDSSGKPVDYRFLSVNPAFERLTGLVAKNVIGRTVLEVMPQTELLWIERYGRVALTGEPASFEQHSVSLDRHFRIQAFQPQPGQFVAVFHDITERKRTETAIEKRMVALTRPLDQPETVSFDDLFDLREIQRLQDEFAAATGVASVITHPDGTPITRPSNFCRLCLGIIRCTEAGRQNCFRSDAVLGRHNPDGPVVQRCLSGGLWDAGASITVGDRHIANWLIGQVRDESIGEEEMLKYARTIGADETAFREAFREVPAMPIAKFRQIAQALFTLASQISSIAYQNVQQARFISDRKRADSIMAARLRLLELPSSISLTELLRATTDQAEALTGSDVGFCHLLAADQVTLELQAWSTRTSQDRCKAKGDGLHYPVSHAGVWVDCIHQRRPVIHNDYASLPHRKGMPEGHTPVIRELVVPVMRGDAIVALLGVGNKPTDYDEQDIQTVSSLADLAWDIAERKRAEEALRVAKDAAEAATQVKDQFLAKLSHELRTPLTPVLLATSQWQTHAEVPASLRDDMAMVCRNLELEARLLDDLLDVNRILYGKLSLRREVIRLHQAISEALSIVAAAVAEKQLTLTLQLQAGNDCVDGDPARMQQIVWNLLSNAIKFTPQAGGIIVTTANDSVGQIRLQITDTGIGIEPDLLSRLFKPFEQGGQHINQQYGGMGLGLTICHSLVESHGGSVTVSSEGRGKGTTFVVRLPVVDSATARADQRDIASAAQNRGVAGGEERVILLVEDNADTARIMSRMLRGKGFAVVTAGDVATALEIAGGRQFDLLISDLGLPDGSGHDLMRQLAASGRQIKAIAVSGYGTEDDLRKSREAGFVEHLVKPISFPKLLTTIERII